MDFGTILGSDCRDHRITMRKEAWGCHSSGRQHPLLGPGLGKGWGWGTQGRKGSGGWGPLKRRLAWVAEPFHHWSRWMGCFTEEDVGALGTWVS